MQNKRSKSRSRRRFSAEGFNVGETAILKSSGQLFLVRVSKVSRKGGKRCYEVEYVDYNNQYSDNVSENKLTKYVKGQYDKVITSPKNKKGNSNDATSFQEKMTFVTVFSNSKQYNFLCSIAALLVIVCLIAETTESTQYGRFGENATIGISPRIGWWLMELPCSTVFIYQFWIVGGPSQKDLVPRILASIFTVHYIYRGWIFPSMINVHNNSKNFSIVPAVFSWIVTVTHALLNAWWLSRYGNYTRKWLKDLRFIIGLIMYYCGFIL